MAQAISSVAAHIAHEVAFSPDGKSVAITSGGNTVQLFDIDSGAARWKSGRRWAPGDITEVAFSADGSLLSVASASSSVLDAGDGHVLMRRFASGGDQFGVSTCISPDGRSLALCADRKSRSMTLGQAPRHLASSTTRFASACGIAPTAPQSRRSTEPPSAKTSACGTQRRANCKQGCTSRRRRTRCSSAAAGTCW